MYFINRYETIKVHIKTRIHWIHRAWQHHLHYSKSNVCCLRCLLAKWECYCLQQRCFLISDKGVCGCIPQLGTQRFSALWFQSTPYDTQCLCPRYSSIFHSHTLGSGMSLLGPVSPINLRLTLKSTAAVWLQQTSHSLTCNLWEEEKRNLETTAEGVDQKTELMENTKRPAHGNAHPKRR